MSIDSSDTNELSSPGESPGELSLAAFNTVVRTYAIPLTRLVLRYVDSRDQADDIVQETFVALWERRKHLELHSTLRAYLFTTARNRAFNHLRNTRGRAHRDTEAFAVLTSNSEPDESDVTTIEHAVRHALTTLPDRIRQAALLRWQDGLSRAEVAQVMGTTVPTVNNQLTTAARRLREALQGLVRGGRLSNADPGE